jgi:hypothetical protein
MTLKEQLIQHEEWRSIPGFPLYEISSLGRVRSLLRFHERPHPTKPMITQNVKSGGKIINGWVRWRGKKPVCRFVALRRDGATYVERVHRLVLLAFTGECPMDMEGCHNDGNPLNNVSENLRWDTHQGNVEDSKSHGTMSKPPVHMGENHHNTKLKTEEVVAIRSEPAFMGVLSMLARRYNTSITTISRIRQRKVWGHV